MERSLRLPVFKDLVANPPASELEFIGMWKLYILTLIAQRMREYDLSGESARKVYAALEGVGLLEREFDLSGVLRQVLDYARRVVRAEAVEGGFTLDPTTGMPAFSGKITFREPGIDLRQRGFLSVDGLLASANDALTRAGYQLWVLLDRLDVAFAETNELERNALRALFRVYRDVSGYDAIKLKIFLRTDIWERITDAGFREEVTSQNSLSYNGRLLPCLTWLSGAC